METLVISIVVLIMLVAFTIVVILIKSLIMEEMGSETQMEIRRSVLTEDYYIDWTGPGHHLTRTTRPTDLKHLESKKC